MSERILFASEIVEEHKIDSGIRQVSPLSFLSGIMEIMIDSCSEEKNPLRPRCSFLPAESNYRSNFLRYVYEKIR